MTWYLHNAYQLYWQCLLTPVLSATIIKFCRSSPVSSGFSISRDTATSSHTSLQNYTQYTPGSTCTRWTTVDCYFMQSHLIPDILAHLAKVRVSLWYDPRGVYVPHIHTPRMVRQLLLPNRLTDFKETLSTRNVIWSLRKLLNDFISDRRCKTIKLVSFSEPKDHEGSPSWMW